MTNESLQPAAVSPDSPSNQQAPPANRGGSIAADDPLGGFREAFDQSPVSTVVYDPTGRPLAVNRAFERLWGATIADVPADYSVLRDPQLEAAGVIPMMRRAFGLDGARSPEGDGEAMTLPALRYDVATTTGHGHTVWTQAHIYPVRNASGSVERVILSHEDITARRLAEARLRESEERYRTLFESIDSGFCVIEMIVDDAGRAVDYRFVEANPAFVKQTGLVDAIGRTAREMVPDLEPHWFETYGRVAETGESVRFENGSEPMGRWFDVYAFRIGPPDARRVALLFTDISAARAARHESEQLLAALEVERARLAYVFQNAPAFVAVMRGPQYVFDFVNNAYLQLIGHRDVLGKPLYEALPEVRNQGFEDLMDQVLRTAETFTGRELPVVLQRTPGAEPEERFIDFIYLPILEGDGRASGVIAHGTDVTEQVRARRDVERARDRADRLQRLTAALAATNTPEDVAEVVVAQGTQATGAATAVLAIRERAPHDPAATAGQDQIALLRQAGFPAGVFISHNRLPINDGGPAAACLRTGEAIFVESREAVMNSFPAVRDRWEKLDTHAFATVPLTVAGETVAAMSFTWSSPRTIPKEDRDFFLALGGQAAQALERARLLTAERSARAAAETARIAAERARREADEANQAKSAFLATMSHEIRTPINAQIGYAQLMELGIAGPVTHEQRQYLTRLAATSEHLRGLVDDILDLAKIDAGGMTVAREIAHTGPLVAAALDLVRPQANAKGVRLVDNRISESGEPFVGDDHRVRQILANLLSNAVKFTRAGGSVTVTCGVRPDTPHATELVGGGPWTFVEVTDTGIGIAPEDQARIFEPFHQVDSRHTRQQGGTGLGLAISRRLARLMGGDQTLESTLGAGSTFTLWLPAAVERRESAAERGARARPAGGSARVHGLAEVGQHLRQCAEDVISAYASRLRADPEMPRAAYLRRSEIEDHQLSFLVDVAQTLVVIEESGTAESDMLRDGSTIQRVVAELHGAMRHRRGWTEAQLEREYTILQDEMRAVVERHAEGGGDATFALGVLDRMAERARGIGLAALRRAAESDQLHGSPDA